MPLLHKWSEFRMRFLQRYTTIREYQERRNSCIKLDTSKGNKVKQYYKWWNIIFSNGIEKVFQIAFDRTATTLCWCNNLQRRTENVSSIDWYAYVKVLHFRPCFSCRVPLRLSVWELLTHINKIGSARMNEWLLAKNNRA